jgi:hypothetical protein
MFELCPDKKRRWQISIKIDNSTANFEKGLQTRIQITGPVQESTAYFLSDGIEQTQRRWKIQTTLCENLRNFVLGEFIRQSHILWFQNVLPPNELQHSATQQQYITIELHSNKVQQTLHRYYKCSTLPIASFN